MNKKGFLEELGTYLAILEDKEQQDILEEYTQHIDMKIENGLSEEEAIRDFGDIRELACGILEAYHVNPEYQGQTSVKRKVDTQAAAAKGKQAWAAASGFFGRTGTRVKRFFCICAGTVRQGAGRIWMFLSSPWRNRIWSRKQDEDTRPEGGRLQGNGIKRFVRRTQADRDMGVCRLDRGRGLLRPGIGTCIRGVGQGIGSFIGHCFRFLVWMALWCIRWCFNICMIFLGLLGGSFTLCMIFIFGASVVWLFHGYPLLGITLISLGTILCFGSVTYLCFSLMRLRTGRECCWEQARPGRIRMQDGEQVRTGAEKKAGRREWPEPEERAGRKGRLVPEGKDGRQERPEPEEEARRRERLVPDEKVGLRKWPEPEKKAGLREWPELEEKAGRQECLGPEEKAGQEHPEPEEKAGRQECPKPEWRAGPQERLGPEGKAGRQEHPDSEEKAGRQEHPEPEEEAGPQEPPVPEDRPQASLGGYQEETCMNKISKEVRHA